MKHIFFLTIIGVFYGSCSKDCGCESPPDCSEFRIFEFKQQGNAQRVVQFNFRGQDVFLLDAGESLYDGTSPIINTECDTVCYFGGLLPLSCMDEMKDQKILWQK